MVIDPPAPASPATLSTPVPSEKTESTRGRSIPRTVKLTSLLKPGQKSETSNGAEEKVLNEPFTEQQLQEAWTTFAEQRRKFQAEYQMLTQPFELNGNQVVVNLLSPVQETMLDNIKIELASYLRERLRNSNIQVTGRVSTTPDDSKMMYTARDKFEYLAEKNPILKELKDRLGLDTDF